MTDIASSSTEPDEAHPEGPSLYQYSSLENKPRTIRLLKIDHDCGNGPLTGDRSYRSAHRGAHHDAHHGCDECNADCCRDFNARMPVLSLCEASLDASPEYEAISYAWGSAALEKQVACDSKVLQVTQSCYDLLCRLRKRDSSLCTQRACSTQARSYWVDAVCINQGFQEGLGQQESSQRERSHQVAMMATIYENALQVVVWPGYIEDDHRLASALDSAGRNVLSRNIPKMHLLIQQPYFTRIWPLQEIALARSCIVLVGAQTVVNIRSVFSVAHTTPRTLETGEPGLDQDESEIISVRYRDHYEIVSVRLEYKRVTALHQRLLGFFQPRSDCSNASPTLSDLSISEVLLHARNHRASERRDKVFALYGMLQRLGTHLEAPNYSRSVEDIYVEASVAAIHTDHSLHIFEGLTGVSNLDLPSWSPDWSEHQHIVKVAEWTDHKASGSSEARPSFHGRELLTSGLLIDVVCQEHMIFAATSGLADANTLAKSLAEPLHDFSNVPVEQYLDLLEKLFLDIWGNINGRSPRDYAHWKWVQNDAKKGTDKKTVCRLIGYRNDGEFTEGFIKHSVILHAGLCHRLDRKKLFETQRGRLGIAAEAVKSGDSIVLLQGCNLPMVIRPAGNKWKLVAPAYLPAGGTMDGKLWKPDGPLSCFRFV